MESLSHSYLAFITVALAFFAPFIALYFALKGRESGISTKAIRIILVLQVLVSGCGYLTLNTGGYEEERVEGIVDRQLLSEHESGGEIVVGFGSLATIVTITSLFVATALRFKLIMLVAALGFFSGSLGVLSVSRGSDLVKSREQTPTYDRKTQMNVPGSFSVQPSTNESMKADDNDYDEGGEDQIEDNERQED